MGMTALCFVECWKLLPQLSLLSLDAQAGADLADWDSLTSWDRATDRKAVLAYIVRGLSHPCGVHPRGLSHGVASPGHQLAIGHQGTGGARSSAAAGREDTGETNGHPCAVRCSLSHAVASSPAGHHQDTGGARSPDAATTEDIRAHRATPTADVDCLARSCKVLFDL